MEQAVRDFPKDPEPLRTLCRFLFEHADPADSEKALKELIRRQPEDAAAHHNLGTVKMRMRRFQPAVEAFQKSLEYRPNSSPTYLHLGYALRECGRLEEAIQAWEQVLRLDPGNSEAKEGIRQIKGLKEI